MQKIKDSQPICIRVNPRDLEALKQADPDMSYLDTSTERSVFQPDATMGRGDCLVETRQGDIDAGIRSQLTLIKEAFATLHGGDI
jgi:flagellar biosynthesis/type III secretory pathway protein FliH